MECKISRKRISATDTNESDHNNNGCNRNKKYNIAEKGQEHSVSCVSVLFVKEGFSK